MEDVSVTAYGISSCRFYDEARDVEFASISDVMEDFVKWVGGLGTIGESSTFEPTDKDAFLHVYCFDVREIPGSIRAYLISTWNESESKEDQIQLLSVDTPIGEPDLSTVDIDPQTRPGYPAYFLVLPERDLLLNMRFEHRLNGSQGFKRFIHGFMAECSKYCVWSKNDETRLLGYSDSGKMDKSGSFLPEFKYQLLRRAEDIQFLRRQVGNIRKVVRRALVQPAIEEHKTFLDHALILLGLQPNNRLKAAINFEYEFKTRLNDKKLEEIIDNYEENETELPWADVGFVMAKMSQKIHWLSGKYAKEKCRIDVSRDANGLIRTEALVATLADGELERLISEVVP